jgi:hypothetical protein
MRSVAFICSLVLLVVALAVGYGRRSAAAAPATSTCGPPCVAAYRAIARALPEDRSGNLAHAILAVPGFDYRRLARALRIPTPAQLRVQWRRRCDALYPTDPRRASRCYRLILSSTYRDLDAPPL